MLNYHDPRVWTELSAWLTRIETRASATCGRVQCPPDWSWRPQLSDYDLWLAVDGRGSMLLNGHTHRIEAGTLLLLRPGDTGWAQQDPQFPLTVLYAHFNFYHAEVVVDIPADQLPSTQVNFTHWTRLEALLTRAIALNATPQPLAQIESPLVLKQALLEVYRQDAANHGALPTQLEPRFERVMTRLRAHPERRVSLDEAAGWLGLSPAHFSRVFTQQSGHSYREYGLRVRLERARYLLEESNLSVTQIAAALGYDDAALFSRQFRAGYGVAPSHLRFSASHVRVKL